MTSFDISNRLDYRDKILFYERMRIVVCLASLTTPCAAFTSLTHTPAWAPRRVLAVRSEIKSKDGGSNSYADSSELSKPMNPFTGLARKLTGNGELNFEEMAKTVSGSVTSGVEGTVREVTGDQNYKFGDLTKGAVTQVTSDVEVTVRKFSGDENYKFGDYSSKIINGADKVLTSWRDDGVNDFIKQFWQDSFTSRQRQYAVLSMFELGSIAILSFGFLSNCFLGSTFALAWAMSCSSTGLSPLSPDQWPQFLQTLQSLRLVVDLPMLPARVLLAVFLTPNYRKAILALQSKLPWKQKKPVLNRVMALGLSFAVANGLAVALFTAALIWLSSLLTGVPLTSVPPQGVL